MNFPLFGGGASAQMPAPVPTRVGLAPAPNAPQAGLTQAQPGGAVPTSTTLDLPPNLEGLINQGGMPTINQQAIGTIPMGTTATNQNAPAFDINLQPTYAQGGMVGVGGMPDTTGMAAMPPATGVGVQTGMSPNKRMTPEIMEMNIQEFLRNNQQEVAEFKQVVQYLISTGELSQQELNMVEQLATTALQNPDMYPYIRNYAIQQGLATEQDLSPEYDEGLIYVLILVARALKSGQPAAEPEPRNFAMGGEVTPYSDGSSGGAVKGPGTGTSDSVPIRVSSGEYVIPAHIVKMKGKEFFDSMLEKYSDKA